MGQFLLFKSVHYLPIMDTFQDIIFKVNGHFNMLNETNKLVNNIYYTKENKQKRKLFSQT